MLNKPTILVIGHARHGKDTVAEFLCDNYGYSFESSSDFVGQRCVWPTWGKDRYETYEEMFEDRVNHRELWSNLINAYNTPDKARTGREMIKELERDMYVGMRDHGEFEACQKENLFDYVIWVDASNRLPPENNPKMTMTKDDADFVIDNNGDLTELRDNISDVMDSIYINWNRKNESKIGMVVEKESSDLPNGAQKVLDHGYILLVNTMGTDADIAAAARLSYGRGTTKVNKDDGLINYLYKNAHTSPFEMCEMKFQMRLPIFVMRQLVRHRTANLNEYSGRYSEMPELWYIPKIEQICSQHATNKQGSGEPLTQSAAIEIQNMMNIASENAFCTYKALLNRGLARETAREILPLNTYTEVVWKMDLNNLLKFLMLRDDEHAQWEIREYAKHISGMLKSCFPLTYAAYEKKRNSVTLTRDELWFLFTGKGDKLSKSELAKMQKMQLDFQQEMTSYFSKHA